MYFITYHGKPKTNNQEVGETIGAYINCYIEADNLKQAEKIARNEIDEMNWDILTRDEAYTIDNESISDEGREYYEQAIIDKAVYVFHSYSGTED